MRRESIMQNDTKIATIYAETLVQVFQDEGREQASLSKELKIIDEQLALIVDILQKDVHIWRFFISPTISWQDKYNSLKLALTNEVSSYLVHFLGLLAKRDRFSELGSISKCFHKSVCQVLGIRDLCITSAQKLESVMSKAEREKLEIAMRAYFNQEVVIREVIDSELLGGLVIRSGDMILDMSLRNKLLEAKKFLLQQENFGEKYYEN